MGFRNRNKRTAHMNMSHAIGVKINSFCFACVFFFLWVKNMYSGCCFEKQLNFLPLDLKYCWTCSTVKKYITARTPFNGSTSTLISTLDIMFDGKKISNQLDPLEKWMLRKAMCMNDLKTLLINICKFPAYSYYRVFLILQ